MITPQVLLEYAVVVTRSFRGKPMLSAEETALQIDELYRSRRLGKTYPKRGTVARAIRIAKELDAHGPFWFDAFLAATYLDGGVSTIITLNVDDFARIEGLAVEPLVAA